MQAVGGLPKTEIWSKSNWHVDFQSEDLHGKQDGFTSHPDLHILSNPCETKTGATSLHSESDEWFAQWSLCFRSSQHAKLISLLIWFWARPNVLQFVASTRSNRTSNRVILRVFCFWISNQNSPDSQGEIKALHYVPLYFEPLYFKEN